MNNFELSNIDTHFSENNMSLMNCLFEIMFTLYRHWILTEVIIDHLNTAIVPLIYVFINHI